MAQSFGQLVRQLNLSQAGQEPSNLTLGRLRDEKTLAAVEAHLQTRGIGDVVSPPFDGHTALVLEIPGGRILRLSDEMAEKSPARNDVRVLQPLADLGSVENIRIELFPREVTLPDAIRQGRVSKAEAANMIKGLVASFARDGLFLWDCQPDNFAVLPAADGRLVPVVLDQGAVVSMNDMREGRSGNDTKTYLDKFRASLSGALSLLGVPDGRIDSDPEKFVKDVLPKEMPPLPYDYKAVQAAVVTRVMEKAKAAASEAEPGTWEVVKRKYLPLAAGGLLVAGAVAFFSMPAAITLAAVGLGGLIFKAHGEAEDVRSAIETRNTTDLIVANSAVRQAARAHAVEQMLAGQDSQKPDNRSTSWAMAQSQSPQSSRQI